MKDGRLTDTVGPMTLTVYTTACKDNAPAPVQGLKVEPAADGKRRLTWQASDAPDFCYYRVFRSDQADFVPDVKTQIGSTIATHVHGRQGRGGQGIPLPDSGGGYLRQREPALRSSRTT